MSEKSVIIDVIIFVMKIEMNELLIHSFVIILTSFFIV